MTASQKDKAPNSSQNDKAPNMHSFEPEQEKLKAEHEGEEQAQQEQTKGQKKRARVKANQQCQAQTAAQAGQNILTKKEHEALKIGKKVLKVTNAMEVNMTSGVTVNRAFVVDDVRLAIGILAAFPQDEDIFKNTLVEFEKTKDYAIIDTKANRHSTAKIHGGVPPSPSPLRHAFHVESMYACLDTVC